MIVKDEKDFRPSVIAVDTDLLIRLSMTSPDYKPEFRTLDSYEELCRNMLKMEKNGHLKFVVLPKTLDEISFKKIPVERRFVREHCYVYEPVSEKRFAVNVGKLASQLVKKGIMDSDFNGKPNADAISISEAGVAGINFVTCNIRHFIDYEDERRIVGNERKRDIQEHNRKMGHIVRGVAGIENIPTAYTPLDFFKLYRKGFFVVSEEFYEAIAEADEADKGQQKTILM